MYKTIFISIASYRDKYCTPTLESIYENATYPQNIYVGICAQNSQDDKDKKENCVINKQNLKLYSANVRTINLKDYEAKGPTWARYLCTTLMNDEDYFLQIDSHTLFEPGWDVILIDMMNDIKNNTSSKDVIISHYPPIYEDYNKKDKNVKNVTALCQSFFNEKGMISLTGAEWVDTTKNKYIQTPHIAGGMIFCEGKCIKEVPYDPNLPNLFVGEEILHAARLWTSGYDMYTPTQNVIYHLYKRNDQPKFWDNKNHDDTDALNKVKLMLQLGDDSSLNEKIPAHVKNNIDKYGLGKKRSLKEYYDFAGIDVKNKKVYKNFCPMPQTVTPKDFTKSSHTNTTSTSLPTSIKEGFTNTNTNNSKNNNATYNKNIKYYTVFLFLAFFLLFIILNKK